jgi:hypothetical protein
METLVDRQRATVAVPRLKEAPGGPPPTESRARLSRPRPGPAVVGLVLRLPGQSSPGGPAFPAGHHVRGSHDPSPGRRGDPGGVRGPSRAPQRTPGVRRLLPDGADVCLRRPCGTRATAKSGRTDCSGRRLRQGQDGSTQDSPCIAGPPAVTGVAHVGGIGGRLAGPERRPFAGNPGPTSPCRHSVPYGFRRTGGRGVQPIS